MAGVNTNASAARAQLYQLLAEALAEPVAWLAQSGHQWPLFTAALQVAHDENHATIRRAVVDMATIPPASLSKRRKRYEALLSASGSASLKFYESLARDEQLVGAHTVALWSVYRTAGLDVAGGELPDHVSIELAFLAYLLDQELAAPTQAAQWRTARRLFVKRHAGQWIPALGDALAQTNDHVYRPLGLLLAATVRSELRTQHQPQRQKSHRLPILQQPETCNLCSFCVQVCPTQAFRIHETADSTALLLDDSKCVACGRCVKTCPTDALCLEIASPENNPRLLVQSPRSQCPACGQPTVSQAELAAVAVHIGQPVWLDYCLDCRSLLETNV